MLDTRNAYKRKGKIPHGSAGKINKTWSLAASMECLNRYNCPPPTTSCFQSEDDEGDEQDTEDRVPEPSNGSSASATTRAAETTRHASKRVLSKRMKTDPVESAIVSLLQKESEEDEDKGFFMSLYKDYKTLADNKKLEAKVRLMQTMYSLQQTSPAHAVQPVTALDNNAAQPNAMAYIAISSAKLQQLLCDPGQQN